MSKLLDTLMYGGLILLAGYYVLGFFYTWLVLLLQGARAVFGW